MYKACKSEFSEQNQQPIFQRTGMSITQQNCINLFVDKGTISHLIWKFHFLNVKDGLKKKSFKETHDWEGREKADNTVHLGSYISAGIL